MIEENKLSLSLKNQSTKKKSIALFGEVLADRFPDRLVLGGAPYNVARHLQAFDQRPVLITKTGDDSLRHELLAEMTRLEMDTSGVQCDPVYPTGQVIVHLEKGGHRFEILSDQAYDYIDADKARQVANTVCPKMRYFGTLAQRNQESRLALDAFLSDAACPRFLDINLRKPWYNKDTIQLALTRADILKLNKDELKTIAKLFDFPDADDSNHGMQLLQQFDLNLLLVTCDAAGAWSLSRDGTITRSTGQNIDNEIVDTVGAGDGFSAVCMLGILEGWPTGLMLDRANIFATALCRVRGAAPQQHDFYMAYKEGWRL